MSFRSDGKDNLMKIKVSYDNTKQTLEVDRDEMWLSLSMGDADGMTPKEMEKHIQDRFDEMFNRPEYNNWHKHDRHSSPTAAPKKLDGTKGRVQLVDDESDELVGNTIDLFPDMTDTVEMDKQYDYDAVCEILRQYLKPEQAELLIEIHINKVPKQEYAARLGISPSAVSHRLETAEKNLKKVFPTSSSFVLARG